MKKPKVSPVQNKWMAWVWPVLVIQLAVFALDSLLTVISARNPQFLSGFYTSFGIPLVIAVVGGYLVYRKSLNLRTRKAKTIAANLGVFTGVLLMVTGFLTQMDIYTRFARVEELSTVEEVVTAPRAVYYRVDQVTLVPGYYGIRLETRTSGRNEDPYWHLYFAQMLSDYGDSVPPSSVWLGKSYSHKLPKRASDAELEELFNTFFLESAEKFEAIDPGSLDYFKRCDEKADQLAFEAGIEEYRPDLLKNVSAPIILMPDKEHFEDRVPGTMMAGLIIWLIGFTGFLIYIQTSTVIVLPEPRPERETEGSPWDFLPLLLPWNKGFVPIILGGTMLVLYLIIAFSGGTFLQLNSSQLIEWGALFEPIVDQGEIWRLGSAIFLHISLMHVAMNVVFLGVAYFVLHDVLSDLLFLLLFLAFGLVAGWVSLWWNDPAFSVGASGALMGLSGLIMMIRLITGKNKLLEDDLVRYVAIITALSLFMGIAGGIDNAAHVGGLLAGLLVGFPTGIFYRSRQATE